MPDVFPVTHSVLSAEALKSQVRLDYEIGRPVECKLLTRGLNDTYLVTTRDGKYVLRVYRKNWRSCPEVLFELEALLHLGNKGVPVSTPVTRRDGRIVGEIAAPEGLRQVTLLNYASGTETRYGGDEAEKVSRVYGQVAAQVHKASDSFHSTQPRFSLDFDHLLNQPLQACAPFFANRPKDWKYLSELADRLRSTLQGLPVDALGTGFCHGDFHGGNAHIDQNGKLTVFDFDCCGIGWRAYDVAVFRWGARLNAAEKEQSLWPAFLAGYTEYRSLSEADLHSIPCFMAVRHFWLLGLHISLGSDQGTGWLNERYFDHALKFFREWDADYHAMV